jgi:hypothetical protein
MALTVEQVEAAIEALAKAREAEAEQKEILKSYTRVVEDQEAIIMETLHALERDNFPGKAGTVFISHKTSFKLPQDPEKKAAYYAFLKEKGLFDSMISVNSMTHNSFCKAELEAAINDGKGLDFAIPGIEPATIVEQLSFRKAK